MSYLNSVTIVGFVGADPEQRQARNNGSKFTVLSVATQRSWKNAEERSRPISATRSKSSCMSNADPGSASYRRFWSSTYTTLTATCFTTRSFSRRSLNRETRRPAWEAPLPVAVHP